MLKRLHLKNFTVFADADFRFGPGLNVLVGTNGTGKTHVLKLGYAIVEAAYRTSLEKGLFSHLDYHFGVRLQDVFQPDGIYELVRRDTDKPAEVVATLVNADDLLVEAEFQIGNDKSNQETINAELSRDGLPTKFPVFIPAKEILSLSQIILGSEQRIAAVEGNYLELLRQLRYLPLKKPDAIDAIKALTAVIGGEIREESDKYYLVDKAGQRTEVNMVAEGLRKFGILQKLLSNGSLTSQTILFWDEPESNLNPALLRKLATILAELARQGFQIILATHSMGLLKEFHILSREKDKVKLPIQYFGLNAESGQATTVLTRDDFEYLPDVVALEVELDQADDLEEIFAREDRQFHANNRGKE